MRGGADPCVLPLSVDNLATEQEEPDLGSQWRQTPTFPAPTSLTHTPVLLGY